MMAEAILSSGYRKIGLNKVMELEFVDHPAVPA
jgi:hypothetical protein